MNEETFILSDLVLVDGLYHCRCCRHFEDASEEVESSSPQQKQTSEKPSFPAAVTKRKAESAIEETSPSPAIKTRKSGDFSKEICAFCKRIIVGDAMDGFKVAGKVLFVHKECALWSSQVKVVPAMNVYNETLENNPKLKSSHLEHVTDAIRTSRSLRCFGCKENGASIGCSFANCKEVFHYHCGQANGEFLVSPHCLAVDGKIRLARLYFCSTHRILRQPWLTPDENQPFDVYANWNELKPAQQGRISRQMYMVEKTLESEGTKDKKSYLVKWLGWSREDSTWEEESRFVDKSILAQ